MGVSNRYNDIYPRILEPDVHLSSYARAQMRLRRTGKDQQRGALAADVVVPLNGGRLLLNTSTNFKCLTFPAPTKSRKERQRHRASFPNLPPNTRSSVRTTTTAHPKLRRDEHSPRAVSSQRSNQQRPASELIKPTQHPNCAPLCHLSLVEEPLCSASTPRHPDDAGDSVSVPAGKRRKDELSGGQDSKGRGAQDSDEWANS